MKKRFLVLEFVFFFVIYSLIIFCCKREKPEEHLEEALLSESTE